MRKDDAAPVALAAPADTVAETSAPTQEARTARRARSWHALAVLQADLARPSMQLFAGPIESEAAKEPADLLAVHVPADLLARPASRMD